MTIFCGSTSFNTILSQHSSEKAPSLDPAPPRFSLNDAELNMINDTLISVLSNRPRMMLFEKSTFLKNLE